MRALSAPNKRALPAAPNIWALPAALFSGPLLSGYAPLPRGALPPAACPPARRDVCLSAINGALFVTPWRPHCFAPDWHGQAPLVGRRLGALYTRGLTSSSFALPLLHVGAPPLGAPAAARTRASSEFAQSGACAAQDVRRSCGRKQCHLCRMRAPIDGRSCERFCAFSQALHVPGDASSGTSRA